MKKAVYYLKLMLLFATSLISIVGLKAQSTSPGSYCAATHGNMGSNGCANGWGFHFDWIELNNVTHSITCNTSTVYRHWDNLGTFTTLSPNSNYTVRMQVNSNIYATSAAAWIDFNGDGSFSAAECIGTPTTGSNTPTYSYSFTVPSNAKPGSTRIRFRCDYLTALTTSMGCGGTTNNYGETMDYDILIISPFPDAAIANYIKPDNICGVNNDSVIVTFVNGGNSALSNIPVTCEITGTLNGSNVNQTLTTTVSGSLTTGQSRRITFPSSFSTNGPGTLTFKTYHSLSNDGGRANDTLVRVMTFKGTPDVPSASDVSRCGVGKVTLSATPGNTTLDSIIWYDAPTGGNQIGRGRIIESPFYYASTKVYAEASRPSGQTTSFINSPTPGIAVSFNTSTPNGWAFDVTPTKAITLDDIKIIPWQTNTTTNYVVYYRVGSYQGQVNNASAWTLMGSVTGNAVANTFSSTGIGRNVALNANTTYGFYIYVLGNDCYAVNGATTVANADLSYSGGVYVYGAFGANGFGGAYSMNVELVYQATGCLNARKEVNVDIKSLPNGTRVITSTPFVGNSYVGNIADPDIGSSGDQLTYEVEPPTGFANAGFGTLWGITSLTLKTPNGTDLPAADYVVTNPTTSSNAKIEIIPTTAWEDSTVIGTISVVRSDNGCDTTFSRTMFIAPRPKVDFTANSVCLNESTSFNNISSVASGSNSYFWKFGDGNTSVLENPTHRYGASGNYTVTLIATTNYGYVDSFTGTVTVKQLPVADFAIVNSCEGTAVQFTDASFIPTGIPTFSWDFGDGSTGSGNNTSKMYNNTGTYKVYMTIDVAGCIDTKWKYASYSPLPNASFTASTSCNNAGAQFTNNSTISSGNMGFEWEFGDGTTATENNPKHVYTNFGSQSVKLIARSTLGCVDSFRTNITLLESPNVSFTANNFCFGDTTVFTNSSSTPSGAVNLYEWEIGSGFQSASASPTFAFPAVGTYTVKLKANSSNGCSNETSQMITIENRPSVSFVANDACLGNPINFNNLSFGSGSVIEYTWDFGNGQSAKAKDTSIVYANANTYTVKLIGSLASGCFADFSHNVVVKPVPSATFTQASAQKGDGSMTFVGPSGSGLRYNWNFGDGGRSTDQYPVYKYFFDGNYTVNLLVINADGCSNSSTQSVNVFKTSANSISESASVSLYPNPNNGSFTLSLEGVNTVGMKLEIRNALGQLVYDETINNQIDIKNISLNTLSKGVYQVSIQNKNEMLSIPFILK